MKEGFWNVAEDEKVEVIPVHASNRPFRVVFDGFEKILFDVELTGTVSLNESEQRNLARLVTFLIVNWVWLITFLWTILFVKQKLQK